MSGDIIGAGTAKAEIRREPMFDGFSVGQRRLPLFGGREATNEGGSEGLRESTREWGILLLPLKLPWFGT